MKPLDRLVHEHQMVLQVLDATEQDLTQLRHTGHLDAARLRRIVDFLVHFMDRCHHSKEELFLFARMRERGVPGESGPLAVLLREHHQSRRHVKALGLGLNKAARNKVALTNAMRKHLPAYIELMRTHIQKEDRVVYPMADQIFSKADQRELSRAFDRIEQETLGTDARARYLRLACELAGVPASDKRNSRSHPVRRA